MQPTIQTFGGQYFDFRDPYVHNFDIEEIAHALSNICRFTGHVHSFYSVAQHSVLVSHLVPTEYRKQGLLHDAHEAYVGDMAAPLKMLLPRYREIERRCEIALRNAFNVPMQFHPCVKQADLQALQTERLSLMTIDRTDNWAELNHITPAPGFLQPLPPKQAFFQFMDTWQVVRND